MGGKTVFCVAYSKKIHCFKFLLYSRCQQKINFVTCNYSVMQKKIISCRNSRLFEVKIFFRMVSTLNYFKYWSQHELSKIYYTLRTLLTFFGNFLLKKKWYIWTEIPGYQDISAGIKGLRLRFFAGISVNLIHFQS